MDTRGQILPYRIDADDLHRFLTAHARGRSPAQIRTLGFAPKTFEGALSSLVSLALLDDKDDAATAIGRRYAVSIPEERPGVLREVIGGFPPYSLLVDAVLAGSGPQPTPLDWVETWWATHGFGSSESNRAEAAPVFAKLVEAAGLGSYIPGRRGHASRIEWAKDAGALVHGSRSLQTGDPVPEGHPAHRSAPSSSGAQQTSSSSHLGPTHLPVAAGEVNRITWQLSAGRLVQVQVPADLSAAEKSKLLKLFELLLGA